MPPTLLTILRRALRGACAVPRGARVLVAVSGGPDSMALLDGLAKLARAFELDLRAHGVDHGLRPEAVEELDLAEAHAARVGVRFERTRLSLAAGGNLQARAREARWKALEDAARRQDIRVIATAHHADDRAETFLLRLLRGAGPRGLAVLPSRDLLGVKGTREPIELIRPLNRARRDVIRAHLSRHAVPCAEDPSNVDPRFQRVRIRREVLPLLEELDPGIVGHIEALADQLAALREPGATSTFPLPRATEEALRKLVHEPSQSARIWLPGGLVAQLPDRADDARTKDAEVTSPCAECADERRAPRPARSPSARRR